MLHLSKNTPPTTADSVLAVLRDTQNYYVHVEYCYPEALHPNDRDEVMTSADYFRTHLSLDMVKDDMEECRWLWAEGEPSPVQVASFILDSNADHGVYSTITISLIPVYPFSEGDDYYTIDGTDVVWSCWDDESEKLHTPDKKYFQTEEQARQYILTNK